MFQSFLIALIPYYCTYHFFTYLFLIPYFKHSSFNYSLLFSRKENFKLFEIALPAVLYNCAVGCIMNLWRYQHWNTANTTLDIYLLFENGHKSTQTRCKVCSNLTSVLQQLTFVLLVSFLLTLNIFQTLL